MKPLHVSLIALLSINLMASSIPAQQRYQEALKSYNGGDFASAYSHFETLSNEHLENAEYSFLLGRSALELKKYDQALIAFDRVLILNPSHTRTRLELARLYYEVKQYEQASRELDLVLKENIPQNIRDLATAFKSRVDESKSNHRFSVTLVVGGGYDDNANNDIGKKEFIVPSFNIPISGNEKVSDSNLFATMVLNHVYDFGDKGGWSLENTLVGYNKLNIDLTKNNLTLFSVSTSPVYAHESYRISMPLNYDRVYLDGKGYMYNLSASLKGAYLIDATSQVEAGVMHKRGFYDKDEGQDVKGSTLFATYRKAFGDEEPLMLSLSTSYSDNAAVNSGRTDVASTGNSYSIELSQSFKNGLKPSLSYTYSTTDFDKVDVLFGTKRADSRDEYEVGLGYVVEDNILINATVTYAKNHSNHDPFTYDKMTALLSAVWSF
jgi:tetratricopeptide (TPR) repeat protein